MKREFLIVRREFLIGLLSLQLGFGQVAQPQPQAPQGTGQATTRQQVEAPPPPLAQQQGAGARPAPGSSRASEGILANVQQQQLPTNTTLAPVRPARNIIVNPYLPVQVPEVRQQNTPRLAELVRAGALYLTLQDAIALALENNIDLELARYGPITASWRVVRAQAGGALPGVPSNASQAGSVALGQGVSGSQAAAGVRIPGGGGGNGGNANAQISQIGPVTQNLDPIIQESSTFSHTSSPQQNAVQSFTNNLISDTRSHAANYQQGLITGGLVNVRYTQNWLQENSPTNILNPSVAANIQVGVQQNLLRGFGVGVNARTIRVSKANLAVSDLTFRGQVITIVNQVINAYYALATSYEQVRASRSATDVAEEFLTNVRKQIELGAVAPPEAINAESQAVTTRRQLVDDETTLRQREVRLKNLISRTGLSDPLLATVRIVPIDRPTIPATDDLPPLEQMVREAQTARTDLAIQFANQQTTEINSVGTRNGLLPTLVAFATMQTSGLAGTERILERPGQPPQRPDPYFVGGIGTALGQVFRRNFPTQRGGAFFGATINNRQAQADYTIDELSIAQNELALAKGNNQLQVDVMNYVVAIQQARARYIAAVKNHELQQQLYESENKRFQLGASIPYNVIQQQRDLVSAQSSEVAALISYVNARLALDQTLGRTLAANNITLTEAVTGTVARPSVPVQPPAGLTIKP